MGNARETNVSCDFQRRLTMDTKKNQIWEDNFILATELDDIIENSHLYSRESLFEILKIVISYLRKTGHELERYDRFIEIYKDILFRLP